jgi:hypothetical protein
MILVEIEDTAINTKSGDKNGKPWSMRFQQITFTGHLVEGFPSKHPRESTIQLEDNAAPYPVGRYVIAADSYFFGDFGRFTMGRLKLQPIKDYLAELQRQLGVSIAFNQPKAA